MAENPVKKQKENAISTVSHDDTLQRARGKRCRRRLWVPEPYTDTRHHVGPTAQKVQDAPMDQVHDIFAPEWVGPLYKIGRPRACDEPPQTQQQQHGRRPPFPPLLAAVPHLGAAREPFSPPRSPSSRDRRISLAHRGRRRGGEGQSCSSDRRACVVCGFDFPFFFSGSIGFGGGRHGIRDGK